jgi:hypothetical protein
VIYKHFICTISTWQRACTQNVNWNGLCYERNHVFFYLTVYYIILITARYHSYPLYFLSPLFSALGFSGIENRTVAFGIKRISSAGILEQSMGARNRAGRGLSYRTARLHRLAESIAWKGFLIIPELLKSLKIPSQDFHIFSLKKELLKLFSSLLICLQLLCEGDICCN